MKFLAVSLAIFLSIALASAQYFGNFGSFGGFGGFGHGGNRGYGLNAITGDFGGFSGGVAGVRDARQNRAGKSDLINGPVVFPASPQDGPMETSGVIVGASGFGFVPPNGQRGFQRYQSFRGFSPIF